MYKFARKKRAAKAPEQKTSENMNVTSRIYNALIRRELPPPICVSDINHKQYKRRGLALLNTASCCVGRAFSCLTFRRACFRSAKLKQASLCTRLTVALSPALQPLSFASQREGHQM